ncbi:MAG: helix-turn-helix transcriptional regulator [Alphaproteobacteria bacterium]|nr:helix-turn-helix transcriptional regulator [Rickettsiales bacterium]
MARKTDKYIAIFKEIGRRIAFFRNQKGLTQVKLSQKIDKVEDTISNIERGFAGTTLETLIDISEALEINLTELLDFPASKEKSKLLQQINSILFEKDERKIKSYLRILEEVGKVDD